MLRNFEIKDLQASGPGLKKKKKGLRSTGLGSRN